MKITNCLLAIALLVVVGSCSKETPVENEDLIAVEYRSRMNQEEQEETQEVFELDLRQYHVIGQIAKLEDEKRELEEAIEGGQEELMANLESVLNKLRIEYDMLESILEDTCHLLKLRAAFLEIQISRAEEASLGALLNELSNIKGELERCGIDVEEYFAEVFEERGIMYVKSWGSKCSPGREWKCKNIMNEGKLLLNIEEEIAERTEVRFKSPRGEVISTGQMVGAHEGLENISQIELDLHQIEQGILEISTENGRFEVPVEVR